MQLLILFFLTVFILLLGFALGSIYTKNFIMPTILKLNDDKYMINNKLVYKNKNGHWVHDEALTALELKVLMEFIMPLDK